MAYLVLKEDETGAQVYRAPMPPYTVPPNVGQLVTFNIAGAPTTRQVMALTTNTTLSGWDYVGSVSSAAPLSSSPGAGVSDKPAEEAPTTRGTGRSP